MSCLVVKNLSKSYNGVHVLQDINLTLACGEVVVIIGPSGSGKSTFLRCMNLLEKPDSGSISIIGNQVDVKNLTAESTLALRKKTGFVFQNYALFKNKNVLNNVAEALIRVRGMKRSEAEAKAMTVLKQVGMDSFADAMPARLSGGQQQRVGIGRALALDAELLLFDEPTSALDPERVYEILMLIKQIAQSGKHTMLIATHEIHFAQKVADRIVFMEHGTITATGKPSELLSHPSNPRIESFLSHLKQDQL